MTARISTARARNGLAGLVRRSARGERIKVTRYGRTLAILIPKGDLQKLEDCERKTEAEARRHAEASSR
jgi:prevent-host-death family protein